MEAIAQVALITDKEKPTRMRRITMLRRLFVFGHFVAILDTSSHDAMTSGIVVWSIIMPRIRFPDMC